MRLPSRVVLPFGYVVLVKEVSDQEMRIEAEDNEDFPDGLFDSETRTIFIRKDQAHGRKKYILSHELIHAVADFQHEMFNDGALKP